MTISGLTARKHLNSSTLCQYKHLTNYRMEEKKKTLKRRGNCIKARKNSQNRVTKRLKEPQAKLIDEARLILRSVTFTVTLVACVSIFCSLVISIIF